MCRLFRADNPSLFYDVWHIVAVGAAMKIALEQKGLLGKVEQET